MRKLSKVDQLIIDREIKDLATEKVSRNQEGLKSYKNIHRLKTGDHRIVYKRTKRETYIILIGHRKNIYKILRRIA